MAERSQPIISNTSNIDGPTAWPVNIVREALMKRPAFTDDSSGKARNAGSAQTAETALRAFAEESAVKAGLFINASRTMLTGQAVGPSMFDVFEIMGCERSAMRLRSQRPWN